MKKQSNIAGKKYQGINKVYEFDKKEVDETINKEEKYNNKKQTNKKYDRQNFRCNSNHSFYKYHKIKIFDNLPFQSKYSFLIGFFNDLEKFDRIDLQRKHKNKKNKCVSYSFRII